MFVSECVRACICKLTLEEALGAVQALGGELVVAKRTQQFAHLRQTPSTAHTRHTRQPPPPTTTTTSMRRSDLRPQFPEG